MIAKLKAAAGLAAFVALYMLEGRLLGDAAVCDCQACADERAKARR